MLIGSWQGILGILIQSLILKGIWFLTFKVLLPLCIALLFPNLDLIKVYHQMHVRSEDILMMAVTTPVNTVEFLTLPFGLWNATSTF